MINHTITLYDHNDRDNIDKCKMHAAVYNKYTDECVEVFGNIEDIRQLYFALKQYFEKESK
jgi:hypothetical protein